jgi:DNA polymerase IV
MNALGLYTGLDMRNQSLDFMQANFGKAGAYYYWISRGVDNREVRANRVRKSVGAENTFSTDLTEFDTMVAELQPLIDKVWRHCEDKGARGRTVTLKMKFNDFEIRLAPDPPTCMPPAGAPRPRTAPRSWWRDDQDQVASR